jgi:hypothetical protein
LAHRIQQGPIGPERSQMNRSPLAQALAMSLGLAGLILLPGLSHAGTALARDTTVMQPVTGPNGMACQATPIWV